MKHSDEKTEYVTRKDLEGLIGEQTQTILSAMEKRFNGVNDHFSLVNDQFIAINGRISSLEKHMDNIRDDLRIDINSVQALIDGYVKAQEDFKQEFEIMKKEHDLMKKVIREKLGLEIKLA